MRPELGLSRGQLVVPRQLTSVIGKVLLGVGDAIILIHVHVSVHVKLQGRNSRGTALSQPMSAVAWRILWAAPCGLQRGKGSSSPVFIRFGAPPTPCEPCETHHKPPPGPLGSRYYLRGPQPLIIVSATSPGLLAAHTAEAVLSPFIPAVHCRLLINQTSDIGLGRVVSVPSTHVSL